MMLYRQPECFAIFFQRYPLLQAPVAGSVAVRYAERYALIDCGMSRSDSIDITILGVFATN